MIAFLLLLSTALATPLDPLVQQCEELWVAGDYAASNRACDQRLAQDANDIEAMWRKARNLYSQGEILADQGASVEKRLAVFGEVTKLGQRIMAIDPTHGAGLHWYAVGVGRTGTTKGVLQSLFLADDVEDAWLKATRSSYRYRSVDDASSLPGDVYFGLGQFYRLVPDWAVVKLLVGTKGDIDKSIEWLRKAAADSPDRAEVAKELGVSLLCKADREDDAAAAAEGRKWLQKALTLPVKKPTDELDRKQIPIVLERADEACGYSRDGWQDVSKESFDKQQ